MNDLKEIPINEFTTFASFDITDMYTNIPTHKLPPVIKDICNQTHAPRRFKNELITLVQTVLKQNYFQFQEQTYIQTKGLAMGAPSSSTLSEDYLQHLEHKTLYKILLTHNILGYFRYVDDILIVYDKQKTNINNLLNSFNNAANPLQFTMEHETNNQINFLDITIKKDNNKLKFNIYRKHTQTDIIIPHDSCHPNEHKLSAIRYLQNRNKDYPTDIENKKQEELIIKQIMENNQYDPTTKEKPKNKKKNEKPPARPHRWAKFTYTGKETRHITKLFKETNIQIAYSTKNNIRHLLKHKQNDDTQNTYNKNGVYQLTCTECNKRYVGQTGRPFHIRYKEHAREFKQCTNKSNYANHLLENRHPLRPMEECMEILHTTPKGQC